MAESDSLAHVDDPMKVGLDVTGMDGVDDSANFGCAEGCLGGDLVGCNVGCVERFLMGFIVGERNGSNITNKGSLLGILLEALNCKDVGEVDGLGEGLDVGNYVGAELGVD